MKNEKIIYADVQPLPRGERLAQWMTYQSGYHFDKTCMWMWERLALKSDTVGPFFRNIILPMEDNRRRAMAWRMIASYLKKTNKES